MLLSKNETIFIAVLCLSLSAFFALVTYQMHLKDNIGGLVIGVFFLACSLIAMVLGSIDCVKTIISYRREKLSCKYGNVKAGDCISKWEK